MQPIIQMHTKARFNSLWYLSPGNPLFPLVTGPASGLVAISLESCIECPDAVLPCADGGGAKVTLQVQTVHTDRKPDIPAPHMNWI